MKPFNYKQKIICLSILIFAAILRLSTINVHGFWLDEVYSEFFTSQSVSHLLHYTAQDVHPPLYYFILYAWRSVVGDSPAAMRSLSALWSLVGMLVLLAATRDIFGNRAAIFALLFAAVHPLEIYFAQEARMYMQGMTLGLLSTWTLWIWMKRVHAGAPRRSWTGPVALYSLIAISMLYTQYAMVFVLLAQGLMVLAFFGWERRGTACIVYCGVGLLSVVAYLPWLAYNIEVSASVYNPVIGWMGKAAPSDLISFLGREFVLGRMAYYHDRWWPVTIFIPLAILAWAFQRLLKDLRNASMRTVSTESAAVVYLLGMTFLPMLLIWLTSQLFVSVLYRPKFSLWLLPPFLMICAWVCASLHTSCLRNGAAALLALIFAAATFVHFDLHMKDEWRIADEWPRDSQPAVVVMFPSALDSLMSFYTESEWHSGDRQYIEKLLPYLGEAEIWVVKHEKLYAVEPTESREFGEWLLGLGDVEDKRLTEDMMMHQVAIDRPVPLPFSERFDRFFIPVDYTDLLNGFANEECFHILETESGDRPFRWSKPKAWFRFNNREPGILTLNVNLPPAVNANYRPSLHLYFSRASDEKQLFETTAIRVIEEYRHGDFEIEIEIPPGKKPLFIGWTINGVNLQEAGISNDNRELGLRVNWIGWKKQDEANAR